MTFRRQLPYELWLCPHAAYIASQGEDYDTLHAEHEARMAEQREADMDAMEARGGPEFQCRVLDIPF